MRNIRVLFLSEIFKSALVYLKTKVYEGRSGKPFASEAELKKKQNLLGISV